MITRHVNTTGSLQTLRWGILGTGKIARIFARSLQTCEGAALTAIGSRGQETADSFGHEFNVSHRWPNYDSVLEDKEVDVVYIATPHTTHSDLTIRAAAAGKHVLCEKPLAVDTLKGAAMIQAAGKARVLLMEAFAYRVHPQTSWLCKLVAQGTIGVLRTIYASFGYDAGPNPKNYLLRKELAGGSILDVGCYTVSMARLLAGSAAGHPFAEPVDLKGIAVMDAANGVDLHAAAVAKFSSGITAEMTCSIDANIGNCLRIVGSEGQITLRSPWLPGVDSLASRILLERWHEGVRQTTIRSSMNLYSLEASRVGELIQSGHIEAPEMSWQDSLGNLRALDAWRHSAGYFLQHEPAAQA
jgi:predicted dehydrogenase